MFNHLRIDVALGSELIRIIGRSLALILSLAVLSPLAGGTFRVPKDEPMATVRIPDKWSVRHEDEFVEATAPGGSYHVMLVAVEGSKVAESMGEAIRYIKRNGTITVRPDSRKQESSTFKGQGVRVLSWEALEKNEAITIRCHVLPVAERRWMVLIDWGSAEADKKHQGDLNRILEMIKLGDPRD